MKIRVIDHKSGRVMHMLCVDMSVASIQARLPGTGWHRWTAYADGAVVLSR
jgi:hypothetical protein